MKKKSLSLTTRVVIIVSALLVALNAVLGVVLALQSQNALMSMINARMLDISNTAAAMVNGDDFASIDEETLDTPEYNAIFKTLEYFQINIECDYIYAVRQGEGTHFYYVIDPDPVEPYEYGDDVLYTDAMFNANKGTPSVDNVAPEEEGFGRSYSSYSPIKNSAGEVVGVIGVDFSKEWYDKQASQNTFIIIISVICSLVIGIAIVIVAMSGVRKSFKKANAELAALSESIDELTEKMDFDGSYEQSSLDLSNEEVDDRISADEINNVSNKVHAMQTMLDKYLVYMNKKAYIDMLTGVNNSSAYYNAIADINDKIAAGTADFAVIIFDLNSLKKVNDAYGHAVGDTFITTAVAIIAEVVGKENIYRVGGDEFIVLLENATPEKVENIMQMLDVTTEKFNERPRPFTEKVTFSKGAAIFSADKDTAFKEVFLRADKAMYDDKAEFYKRNGQ